MVTSYVNPDIDGTAGALAYSDLLRSQGHQAEVVLFGRVQAEVEFFVEKRGLVVPLGEDDGQGAWSHFVLVDVSSIDRLPKVIRPRDVIEVIDHREAGSTDFPQAQVQNELVGAAATLIVERFQKAHQLPAHSEAELLYAAIGHGTVIFTAFNTTSRDKVAFEFLQNKFGLSSQLVWEMFDFELEKTSKDLKVKIIDDAKSLGEGMKVMIYQLPTMGREIKERESEIVTVVKRADRHYGSDWSVLNIFNMKEDESLLFCASDKGRQIVSQALGVEFQGNWSLVRPRLFRKQLIPKIRQFLDYSKS